MLNHWDAVFLIHQNIFISVKKFCGKYRAFIWSRNTNTHPLTAWTFLATGPMGVFSKTLQCLTRSMASPKVLHFNLVIGSQGSTSQAGGWRSRWPEFILVSMLWIWAKWICYFSWELRKCLAEGWGTHALSFCEVNGKTSHWMGKLFTPGFDINKVASWLQLCSAELTAECLE